MNMTDTKKRIVQISIRLIKENGYDNVTINDICEKSKVSKNTFYYYFKSKDDVLLAYHTLPNELPLNASLLAKLIEEGSNFEKFMSVLQPMIKFFENAGTEIMKRIYILNLANPETGTFIFPKNEELFKIQSTLLENAQNNNEIGNKAPAKDLNRIIFKQILGTVLLWCISDGKEELEVIIRHSLETLLDVSQK